MTISIIFLNAIINPTGIEKESNTFHLTALTFYFFIRFSSSQFVHFLAKSGKTH